MSGFENQSAGANGSQADELRGELQTLRMLMTVVLVVLIGLSLCADYFLSHQTANLQAEAGQAQLLVNSFPLAAANEFVTHLKEYSRVHADFAPIAAKYGVLFGQPQQQPAVAPKK